MTQFAIFSGPKPQFGSYQSVPLAQTAVAGYAGDALSDQEKSESWVMTSPEEEVVDGMCCDAMILAQAEETIEGTELHDFLVSYLPRCTAVTLFYGTESDNLPHFEGVNNSV